MELIKYESKTIKDIWGNLSKIIVSGYNIPKYIRKTLKTIYEPNNKWVSSNEYGGVYNTEHPLDIGGRSLLNYLDTNYTSISILLNWINNEIIKDQKYNQIDLYNGILYDEIKKFFQMIYKYKFIIFNNDSDILNDIFIILNKTSKYGDYIEKMTINKLKEFNDISDIKQAKFGERLDMFGGIDITFKFNNKIWSIQCKSYGLIKKSNNKKYYIISGISHAKDYTVNLYSFYNPIYGFYIFDNKNIKRFNNTLYIPIENKRLI
jgi:hypothetical protein